MEEKVEVKRERALTFCTKFFNAISTAILQRSCLSGVLSVVGSSFLLDLLKSYKNLFT